MIGKLSCHLGTDVDVHGIGDGGFRKISRAAKVGARNGTSVARDSCNSCLLRGVFGCAGSFGGGRRFSTALVRDIGLVG